MTNKHTKALEGGQMTDQHTAVEMTDFIKDLAIRKKNYDQLDDLVHDIASRIGTYVNNGGIPDQVKFIYEELGPEEGQKAILSAFGLEECERPTKEFTVRWEIDFDATSEEEAVRMAMETMRDPQSIALVFEVRESNTDRWVEVDGEHLEDL